MTDLERLIVGAETAIEVTTEYLEEAESKVPDHQWYEYTHHLRQMLYAQMRWLHRLGGRGGIAADYEPPKVIKPRKMTAADLHRYRISR